MAAMKTPGQTRVAVMIDGSYFNRVSTFYKFEHEVGRRLSLSGLMDFIRIAAADMEDVPRNRCRVVEAHYFRGRYTLRDLEDRAQTANFVVESLRNDRVFDQILAVSNITPHFTRIDTNSEPPKEQGIDVWLALEAFDLAVSDRTDVVALVAGDGDFVPLVKKINAIGKRALVVAWGMKSDQGTQVRYSGPLAAAAAYFLDMADLIDNPDEDEQRALVDQLFVDN
ncbi:NYN domain-containing protein [Sandarakinorhabdus sp.]|uniref:NYN domain-containing protein n=1 Tax=Sandarakinorhabdus sp. TaxID=1916663 RepID=UPI003569669E